MPQDCAQQAIAQGPRVAGPDPRDGAAFDALAKDRVDAVAQPRAAAGQAAVRLPSLPLGGASSRCGRPPASRGGGRHLRDRRQCGDIGRRQADPGNHPGPCPAHMHAETVAGLARKMLLAVGSARAKTPPAIGQRGAGKLADGQRKTIDESELLRVRHLCCPSAARRLPVGCPSAATAVLCGASGWLPDG
jgi:hypothetical protein